MKILIALTSVLLLSLPAQGAGADIQLVSEVESVEPGVPFTVGLHVLPQKRKAILVDSRSVQEFFRFC